MENEEKGGQTYEFRRLQSIIDGDGLEIRRQFVLAGLLLMIFERFREYVTNRVDGFFASYVEIEDGQLTYTRGEAFKVLIKERGSGDTGQHTNKAFRAALSWFHELNAIDKEAFDEIERLYALRNEIGHELFEIIADDTKKPVTLLDVLMTFGVYVTIVRWWVKEIDATTDPYMTREKYEKADWDGVESADTMFLRLIIRKSLAGDAEWEALQAKM